MQLLSASDGSAVLDQWTASDEVAGWLLDTHLAPGTQTLEGGPDVMRALVAERPDGPRRRSVLRQCARLHQ